MGGKKKAPVILDLSKVQPVHGMPEFEVEDYDYEQRQGHKVAGFEEDLEFLLSEQHKASSEGQRSRKAKKAAKTAAASHTSVSSKGGEHSPDIGGNSGAFSEAKPAETDRAMKKGTKSGPGPKSAKPKKSISAREVQRLSRREITGDLDGIEFSSDDEAGGASPTPQALRSYQNSPVSDDREVFECGETGKKPKRGRRRKIERKNAARASSIEPSDVSGVLDGSSTEKVVENAPKPGPERVSTPVKNVPETPENAPEKVPERVATPVKSVPEAVSTPAKETPERISTPVSVVAEEASTPVKKTPKKRRTPRKKKADTPEPSKESGDGDNLGEEGKPGEMPVTEEVKPKEISPKEVKLEEVPTAHQEPPKKEPKPPKSPKRQSTPTPTLTPTATPDTTPSKPSESPSFSRLSSAKATQVKQLPAVQPVSTIIGLSHEQIYRIKLTDVKVKTIANVPMSKMCKNALNFVMSENQGLFLNDTRTGQFVDLCTKVALFEAPGFNEVTKRIPELLEWVPEYEPLTLQHTKTNVTMSSKQIHQNSLDYTVFAFFGHILIWANELQHVAKLPTVFEKYELGIKRGDILNSLGGYHLWDRLRRDKTINTKRWKHIQKYRQLFAFEENQFVLILRCMNLRVPVC